MLITLQLKFVIPFEINVLENLIDVNGYTDYAKKKKKKPPMLPQINASPMSLQIKHANFAFATLSLCGFHPVFITLRYICLLTGNGEQLYSQPTCTF